MAFVINPSNRTLHALSSDIDISSRFLFQQADDLLIALIERVNGYAVENRRDQQYLREIGDQTRVNQTDIREVWISKISNISKRTRMALGIQQFCERQLQMATIFMRQRLPLQSDSSQQEKKVVMASLSLPYSDKGQTAPPSYQSANVVTPLPMTVTPAHVLLHVTHETPDEFVEAQTLLRALRFATRTFSNETRIAIAAECEAAQIIRNIEEKIGQTCNLNWMSLQCLRLNIQMLQSQQMQYIQHRMLCVKQVTNYMNWARLIWLWDPEQMTPLDYQPSIFSEEVRQLMSRRDTGLYFSTLTFRIEKQRIAALLFGYFKQSMQQAKRRFALGGHYVVLLLPRELCPSKAILFLQEKYLSGNTMSEAVCASPFSRVVVVKLKSASHWFSFFIESTKSIRSEIIPVSSSPGGDSAHFAPNRKYIAELKPIPPPHSFFFAGLREELNILYNAISLELKQIEESQYKEAQYKKEKEQKQGNEESSLHMLVSPMNICPLPTNPQNANNSNSSSSIPKHIENLGI